MAKKRAIKKNGTGKNLSLEELVEQLIQKSMKALENNEIKVTVADLIRARQLQKELAPPPPLRAEVTWIDGWE